MRINNELDFSKETEEIIKDCSDILADETQVQVISLKLLALKQDLNNLKQDLILAKSYKNRDNLTANMKKAYTMIMKFRSFLLGENQTINYRIYLRSDSLNSVRVIDVPEEELMKHIERSGNTLRLKRTLDNIEQTFNNSKVQKLFDEHFQSISHSLKHISGNNFVVPFNNVKDVIKSRVGVDNLYWQTDNGRGKSAYTPKKFNRGWIYQAFDSTVNELYDNKQQKEISKEQFRFSYFTKHLAYDNVKGFKGGDVGLTQIKSNMAQLINITTLINYLDIINTILTPEAFSNSQELSSYIQQNFTNQKESISKDISTIVDQVATQLLSALKKFDQIKNFQYNK